MADSCSRTRNAMHFLLVVAWRDLASLVAINLRRHRFWPYDVPRYARCRYLTINSAYCCHRLMNSMKNLIVASSRLTMVEPLSLRNIKKCYVIASMQWETCSCMRLRHCHLGYDVKIRSSLSLLAMQRVKNTSLLSRMTIKLFAHCNTTYWFALLFAIPRGHRSLACSRDTMKNLYYCCSLIVIQHKNKLIVRHRSQC